MWLWLYCQGIGAACPLHLDVANNDLTGRRIVSNQIKELIVQLHNEVSLKECGDLKPCLVSASHHEHYLCKIKHQTPDSHLSHLASVPPSVILSLLMSEPSYTSLCLTNWSSSETWTHPRVSFQLQFVSNHQGGSHLSTTRTFCVLINPSNCQRKCLVCTTVTSPSHFLCPNNFGDNWPEIFFYFCVSEGEKQDSKRSV